MVADREFCSIEIGIVHAEAAVLRRRVTNCAPIIGTPMNQGNVRQLASQDPARR